MTTTRRRASWPASTEDTTTTAEDDRRTTTAATRPDRRSDGFSGDELEDLIADTYEETFGLSRDQAECLAGKMTEAIEDGSLTEEQAFTEVFDYLSDCDISLDEISGNCSARAWLDAALAARSTPGGASR